MNLTDKLKDAAEGTEAAPAVCPGGTESEASQAAAKCIQCDRELSASEVRFERAVCGDCLHRHGKVADLEVAIRAQGDNPDRITQWQEIHSWLCRRYGARAEIRALLERQHLPSNSARRARLTRELNRLLWTECTVDLKAAGFTAAAYLTWPTSKLLEWLRAISETPDVWLKPDSPSHIAVLLDVTLGTLHRWRAQGRVRIEEVSPRRWKLHREDAEKFGAKKS